MKRPVPAKVRELIAAGAVFFVNHSGGKDSQAMTAYLRGIIPASQLRVIHAILPEVEWDGVREHVEATTVGLELITCQSRRTLLQMIEQRGMFPSPKYRQCTSDLKRGPIEKAIRATGAKLIVNCMGLRAEESASRAKHAAFKRNARNSKNGRDWYDWLPIHAWTVAEVFAEIKAAGQEPHWAYKAGMTRLSCCFCIMASKADLTTAAKLNPELYARYVDLEQRTGQVMMMPSKAHGRQTLEQITGVKTRIIPIKQVA